jgi:hypothetical protein
MMTTDITNHDIIGISSTIAGIIILADTERVMGFTFNPTGTMAIPDIMAITVMGTD